MSPSADTPKLGLMRDFSSQPPSLTVDSTSTSSKAHQNGVILAGIDAVDGDESDRGWHLRPPGSSGVLARTTGVPSA
jgi:hypothetical protein